MRIQRVFRTVPAFAAQPSIWIPIILIHSIQQINNRSPFIKLAPGKTAVQDRHTSSAYQAIVDPAYRRHDAFRPTHQVGVRFRPRPVRKTRRDTATNLCNLIREGKLRHLRRGPHYAATTVAQTLPSTLTLTLRGHTLTHQQPDIQPGSTWPRSATALRLV